MSAWALARLVSLEMVRRKDAYILVALGAAAVILLLQTDAFGAAAATRHVVDAGLTLTWLISLLLAISASARLLPRDHATGVIYVWLSKPVGRLRYWTGQWLGIWTFVSLLTMVGYGLVTLLARSLGGTVRLSTLAQAIALHVTALAAICSLTMAVSTRWTTAASAVAGWILVLGSYTLAARVPSWLRFADPVRSTLLLGLYYLWPQWGLLDLRLRLTHDWGPAPAWAFGLALAYGWVWTFVGGWAAWWLYRRRYFPRVAE